MNILTYKGYDGTAELDMETTVCRGKILFIDDLVTYESDSPKELQRSFEEAVDDYLETCADVGKNPDKPLKGLFNVRITPALHKSAVVRALKDGVTLNELVGRSISAYVNADLKVTHNHHVCVTLSEESGWASTSALPRTQFQQVTTHGASN